MQRRTRFRIIWSEYEIQSSGPPIMSWPTIIPGSARWFAWLAQIPSFAFQARDGGHFTARKETRARGGAYWIAYRHSGGQLLKKYIGPQTQVTIARLEEIVGELERRAGSEA